MRIFQRSSLHSLVGPPFRIAHYCYLFCSTVCHLRKCLDIKLTYLGTEQMMNSRALTVWLKTYLSWEGPPAQESSLSFLCGVVPPDGTVKEEHVSVSCHLTTSVTRTRQLLCSRLENGKGGKTAAPSLELKGPWLHANFLLQLFTDKTGQGRRPPLL